MMLRVVEGLMVRKGSSHKPLLGVDQDLLTWMDPR